VGFNFWFRLVRLLPKKSVYFCFMLVVVHGTTGRYNKTDINKLTAMEAIKRFADDNNIM